MSISEGCGGEHDRERGGFEDVERRQGWWVLTKEMSEEKEVRSEIRLTAEEAQEAPSTVKDRVNK